MKLQLKSLPSFSLFPSASLLMCGLAASACVTASVDPAESDQDVVAEGDGDGDGDMDTSASGGTTGTTGSGGAFGSGGMSDEPLPVEAYLPMTVTDYYAASGFMGADNSMVVTEGDTPPLDEVEGLTMDPLGCDASERPVGAVGECYHVHYEPQYLNCTAVQLETDPNCENGSTWVGMFFQSPSMNWGELQGTVIEAGATKIVFSAWTEEGELDIDFLAGGVGNLGTAHVDSFKLIQPTTITAVPTEYSLSLASATYEDVIAAFGWVLEKEGPDSLDFYIDDIRWVKE